MVSENIISTTKCVDVDIVRMDFIKGIIGIGGISYGSK